MDDLCVVSARKYKHIRRAAIVMPIVAAVLVTALLGWVCAALAERYARHVPDEGVWYCEELDCKLDFDCPSGDILTDTNGTQYLILCGNHTRSMEVLRIASAFPVMKNGELIYQYEAGESLYWFSFARIKGNRYTVSGEDGNEYVFVRE